jgi:hypothetical protein
MNAVHVIISSDKTWRDKHDIWVCDAVPVIPIASYSGDIERFILARYLELVKYINGSNDCSLMYTLVIICMG